jgi:dTDP-4-dehydrorhamnose reductase
MAEAVPLRMLLLGAQGQLGHALAQTLPVLGQVLALGRQQADLTQAESLRALLDQHQPQLIVNAAAYTAVDKAEQEPGVAHAINAQAPAVLAQWAAAHGAVLVHYSTDYVFDGQSPQPYTEVDVPAPQSVYGQSKWAGERAVQAAGGRHLVFRTSWVVGAHGGNFLKTMLRLGAERDSLRVVADQHGAPTAAADLAAALAHIACRLASEPDAPTGTFHFSNAGQTTWADFATEIFRLSAARGGPCARVEPITTADYPTPARRPH